MWQKGVKHLSIEQLRLNSRHIRSVCVPLCVFETFLSKKCFFLSLIFP